MACRRIGTKPLSEPMVEYLIGGIYKDKRGPQTNTVTDMGDDGSSLVKTPRPRQNGHYFANDSCR